METKSLPKQKVLEFIKINMESNFTFYYKGDREAAARFVHRMRVELSRLRAKVRKMGRATVPFKMIQLELTPVDNPEGHIKVVLKKTMHHYDPSKEIDDIFDDIAGGGLLNV